ncbi:hypothetical protein EG240_04500 [Paenimyroides tangerinum]|uniref:Lipoprotein n=1 Tax=Paenimyroides tangerinum TaxID=2488728 RepID=A0A3P3WGV0_9FLAO|nr:hypothetical protein [Paenimyroides tangerinum]RRJ91823.1 hypothetical protein EG240_04500 [Paenimyroides tangerinum]
MKAFFLFKLMFLISFVSCNTSDKKFIPNNNTENSNKEIVVKNIDKTCYKNVSDNIINYMLCIDWNLNESDIQEIIELGEKETYSEIIYTGIF